MREIAIGLAVMWAIVAIRGSSFEVKGVLSIALMAFVAWGLGSLVMLPFN